jgi:rare lipoprotein A
MLALVLASCATSEVGGRGDLREGPPGERSFLPEASLTSQAEAARAVYEGRASYYSRSFVGRKTASGERYDPQRYTAAHASLPLGTRIRVTRVPSGPSVIVRVNDRCGCTHGRIVDLSEAAARKLDMLKVGVVSVRLEVLRK